MSKKPALGRGVDILFGGMEEEEGGGRYLNCPLEQIEVNTQQPRQSFADDALEDLTESIREQGIIQPLVVRETELDGVYELIAGERRLRAAKRAGLESVPVVVREIEDDVSMLELALIENVQRTDLNPIEEAEAYQKLIDKFNYTQEEAAKKVGKQRSTITNAIRLLKLPEDVKNDIIGGRLSEGHGRALLKLVKEPLKMYDMRNAIFSQHLSVRQTEQAIKKLLEGEGQREKAKAENAFNENYVKSAVSRLSERYQSKIAISQRGEKGKIEIGYDSPDDLERLMAMLLEQ